MTFTDEHLKQLCEEMEDRNCVGYAKITIPLFSALVARLECAEKALLNSEYQEANEHLDAWRKAAGRMA